jgi:hypothetical protein
MLGTDASKPLPNTVVRVKSKDGEYATVADTEGLYSFYDLPAGRYEFRPDLPQGTTLSWYIGSDKPQVPFEIRGIGCQERDIEVFAVGVIQGRVLDSSNSLLPDALVYIVPADRDVLPKGSSLYWESQGKEGYFKFVHIPPGRYYVLVNPDDKQQPDFPYRRTYYPGVHDREEAAVITVRASEQVKDIDIRLQQLFVARHVSVRVKWADGSAIRSFVYIAARGITNPEQRSTASTDARARVADLKLVPTEAYQVQAELTCRYADDRSVGPGARLVSSTVYVKPEDGQNELTLIIPAKACPAVQGKTLVTDR